MLSRKTPFLPRHPSPIPAAIKRHSNATRTLLKHRPDKHRKSLHIALKPHQQGFLPSGHKKGRRCKPTAHSCKPGANLAPVYAAKIKPKLNPCKRFVLHRPLPYYLITLYNSNQSLHFYPILSYPLRSVPGRRTKSLIEDSNIIIPNAIIEYKPFSISFFHLKLITTRFQLQNNLSIIFTDKLDSSTFF